MNIFHPFKNFQGVNLIESLKSDDTKEIFYAILVIIWYFTTIIIILYIQINNNTLINYVEKTTINKKTIENDPLLFGIISQTNNGNLPLGRFTTEHILPREGNATKTRVPEQASPQLIPIQNLYNSTWDNSSIPFIPIFLMQTNSSNLRDSQNSTIREPSYNETILEIPERKETHHIPETFPPNIDRPPDDVQPIKIQRDYPSEMPQFRKIYRTRSTIPTGTIITILNAIVCPVTLLNVKKHFCLNVCPLYRSYRLTCEFINNYKFSRSNYYFNLRLSY